MTQATILGPACAVAFVLGAGVGAGGAILLQRRPPSPLLEETRFLNFDPESTSLKTLAVGWSGFERNKMHDTFVWCAALQCSLEIEAHDKRDRLLRLRTFPFHYPGVPMQTVRVTVNGIVAGTHDMASDAETWGLTVSSSAWQEGQNIIQFDFAYAEQPAAHWSDSRDTRTLSCGFDWLEIDRL